MKRIQISCIAAVLLFAASSLWSADWRLTFGFSKYLDLRLGTEVSFTDKWGMKADVGFSLLSSPPEELFFTADLTGFYTFTRPEQRFIVRGHFGFIDASFIILSPPVFAFSPGVSVFTGIRLGKRFDIGLKGGIGTWIMFEEGEVRNQFPWFDIVLECHVHFRSWERE